MLCKGKKICGLIIAIVICHSAGLVGTIFTESGGSAWYDALNKPAFTPPNWLFGPVWLIMYTLMGLAAYLIWRVGFKYRKIKIALAIFIIQLALNGLWSFIFFAWHSPEWALIDILALWIMVLASICYFWNINKWAGYFMIPYLAWVTFAAALNYLIISLN